MPIGGKLGKSLVACDGRATRRVCCDAASANEGLDVPDASLDELARAVERIDKDGHLAQCLMLGELPS